MKKMTCKELGGPCDAEVTGDTFEEIGEKCKSHVMVEIQKGDEAHTSAAVKMRDASPEEQQKMFAEFRKRYEEAGEV